MSQSPPLTASSAINSKLPAASAELRMGTPQSARAPAPTPNPDHDLDRLFGLVRDIRAEAQNLQTSLAEIKSKTELVDNVVRENETRASLAEQAEIFKYNRVQIDERLRELRAFLNANPGYYSQSGDDVTFIENHWERASLNWPQQTHSLSEVLVRIATVDRFLGLLICRCGLVTIPERVDRHLRQLRVGRSLDFHNTFKDELPLVADRIEVLDYLFDHPLAIEGVVDAVQGLIYRTSANVWRRVASWSIPILLPLLGALFLLIADRYFRLLPKDSLFQDIMRGYWVLIAGGYTHVIIGALKEARAKTGKVFLAIEDWLLWLHIKELQIMVGILSLWVGVIGVLVINKSLPISTAFFVGYSIDSFADLFLERFSATVTNRTDALKQALVKT